MTKFCNGCRQERGIQDWPRNRSKKDGLGTRCKSCAAQYRSENSERLNEYRKSYYHADPSRYRKDASKHWKEFGRDRKYGLEPGTILNMLEYQNYQCANSGCRTPIDWTNSHLDHDHSCCSGGKSCGLCVRGLLCPACNHILGRAADSAERLSGLVAYLSRALEEV